MRVDSLRRDDRFGVYVHVPFCRARCDYCAFATWTDRDHVIDDYVAAMHGELAWRRDQGSLRRATSVFFGGGTPSRIEASALVGVLGAIERTPDAEVTVECNPEDADAERLGAYRDGGVTRMSFGIQSTSAAVLEGLGRRHGTGALAQVARAVAEVGFATWNVDVIIGSVDETDADLERTLLDIVSLDDPPPHVSAYALTPEPGTPLGRDRSRHPDDDVVAARYELVDRVLEAEGYRWEEISNWALPGDESRHNRLYWDQGEYAGIGCAAHSHRNGVRSWNVRTPERYIAAIASGAGATAGSEVLDDAQRRFESLSLSLRTSSGVPADAFDDVSALGDLVERRGDRVVLSVRGRLLANLVTVELAEGAPLRDR